DADNDGAGHGNPPQANQYTRRSSRQPATSRQEESFPSLILPRGEAQEGGPFRLAADCCLLIPILDFSQIADVIGRNQSSIGENTAYAYRSSGPGRYRRPRRI